MMKYLLSCQEGAAVNIYDGKKLFDLIENNQEKKQITEVGKFKKI